jgi:hypothetical protein
MGQWFRQTAPRSVAIRLPQHGLHLTFANITSYFDGEQSLLSMLPDDVPRDVFALKLYYVVVDMSEIYIFDARQGKLQHTPPYL